MKVSKARPEKALELRDAAMRILTRTGRNAIIADSERGYCHHVKRAKIDDLTVMYSSPEGEHTLDVWQGTKVFSIAWRGTRTPYVARFCPGDWERILREKDVELTLSSVQCSIDLKSWLTGGQLPDNK
jgi:hypothetical protein